MSAAAPPQRRRGLLLILLVAVLAMAPELVLGLSVSDSFRYNLLWPEQFAGLFREGHLYPRWLPHAWGGLGNPTFYFYPPLYFWVTAAVDTLTFGALPPERFTPVATLLVLAVSGLAMRAWLKEQAPPRAALWGSAAYMVAPYHLYDIYARGALAEATGYAVVPLIALSLKRLAEGRSRHLPLLALGYAALLLTHLPTALLVTLFLIAPYTIFLAAGSDRRARFLAEALAGGLLGTGLAAIYVVPALGLFPYVSADALSSSFYRPENWFFWHVNAGEFGGRMLLIVPVSVGAALLAIAAGMAARAGNNREPLFWAALTVILVVLIAGAVPPLWQLPGLKLVQFPWRALVLVEFAAITTLASAAPQLRAPLVLAGAAALALAYSVFGMLVVHVLDRTWTGQASAAAEIRRDYADAPEYLPAGTKIVQGSGPSPKHIELPPLRVAQASDPRARLTVAEAKDGGISITVAAPAATAVTLPRFAFPHWEVRDESGRVVPIAPTPAGRLVSFEAPSGQSTFRLVPGPAPYQRTGETISLIALLLLGAVTLATRRVTARVPGNSIG
jgi:hypothetical protein